MRRRNWSVFTVICEEFFFLFPERGSVKEERHCGWKEILSNRIYQSTDFTSILHQRLQETMWAVSLCSYIFVNIFIHILEWHLLPLTTITKFNVRSHTVPARRKRKTVSEERKIWASRMFCLNSVKAQQGFSRILILLRPLLWDASVLHIVI